MRRFVATLPGRALCHALVAALLMPFLTLVTATRAEAQIVVLPTWAVVDFVNRSGKGGDAIGRMAAEAVSNELSKTQRYDVLPREQIARQVETLQLATPVVEETSLFRLAGELRATEVVTGEVLNWQIRPTGNGKQADVIVRAVVRNVASMLPVNGAATSASSSERPGDVADEVVLAEAFSIAATRLVNEVVNRTLPRATVLNTFEDSAIINQGTRSGIKIGQRVIILRGQQQVASGDVIEASYDDATVRVRRSTLGMRPGDKVQVIFDVPTIESSFNRDGAPPRVRRTGGRRNNSAFIQTLLVAGLLAFLFSGGRGRQNDVVQRVRAEATFTGFATGPGVRVTWSTDIFVQGNEQLVEYHVYRSDVPDVPVLVVPGSQNSVIDTTAPRDVSYSVAPTGSFGCPPVAGAPGETGVPGITPGQPYQYEVELLYRVRVEDIPGNPPGGTSGFCYFMSTRRAAQGVATPINRPELVSPQQNATIQTPTAFTANSVVTAGFPFVAEYVLQFSTSPEFRRGQTETIGPITSASTSQISFGVIDTFNGRLEAIREASTVWWRVGARNSADRPGPVPDASGQRYIFSAPRSFNRPTTPPPPPGGGGTPP